MKPATFEIKIKEDFSGFALKGEVSHGQTVEMEDIPAILVCNSMVLCKKLGLSWIQIYQDAMRMLSETEKNLEKKETPNENIN